MREIFKDLKKKIKLYYDSNCNCLLFTVYLAMNANGIAGLLYKQILFNRVARKSWNHSNLKSNFITIQSDVEERLIKVGNEFYKLLICSLGKNNLPRA